MRTFTEQLQQLADWLLEQGVGRWRCTNVYWIPLYELLESCGIEVLLVNARQLRYVPGRKTDMQDSQWIQLLHSCGLLRGSFRPHEVDAAPAMYPFCPVDAEGAGSDERPDPSCGHRSDRSDGDGDRAAIVDGERDPVRLAGLRDRRCKKSSREFAEHLRGNWRDEHLFNLKSALKLYDMTQRDAARILEEIQALQPVEHRDQPVPTHPNAIKEKAIRRRGGHKLRTELWRFAGVDLTRIDGIGTPAST